MPSPKRGYIAAALVLIGIGGFAYSVVLIGQVLIGAGFTLSALVVAALVYYGDAERHTLTRYHCCHGCLWGFTGQLPVAVIAACVVYLSAWLTGPDSPVNSPDTEIFPVTQTTTDESEYTD